MRSVILAALVLLVAGALAPRTSAILYGDADCGGTVDSIDAMLALQLDAGLIPSVPCPANADVNADARVDSLDALAILQYVAGLVGSLGPAQPPTATAAPTSTVGPPFTPTVAPTATPAVSALECQFAATEVVAVVRSYGWSISFGGDTTLQDVRYAALLASELCSASPLTECANVLSEGVLIESSTTAWASRVIATCDIPAF